MEMISVVVLVGMATPSLAPCPIRPVFLIMNPEIVVRVPPNIQKPPLDIRRCDCPIQLGFQFRLSASNDDLSGGDLRCGAKPIPNHFQNSTVDFGDTVVASAHC